MPMRPWVSILTLHECYPTLFDGLSIPNGVDKELLVENLVIDLAELELLYSDPAMLQRMITAWSRKELPVWTELYETLHYDYNPIHNYDRTEEVKNLETRDLSAASGRTHTSGIVEGNEQTGTTNSNGTETTSKTAYDSASFVPAQEVEAQTGNNQTLSMNRNLDQTDTDNVAASDTGTVTHDNNLYAYGNIGVTSTQDLIKQQREIVEFNLIDYIINSFKMRFCILVY